MNDRNMSQWIETDPRAAKVWLMDSLRQVDREAGRLAGLPPGAQRDALERKADKMRRTLSRLVEDCNREIADSV
jgi:hypothetical protein